MTRKQLPDAPAEMLAPAPGRATMTGYCMYPSPGSHGFCHENFVLTGRKACLCPCHDEEPAPSSEGFGTVSNFIDSLTADRAAGVDVVHRVLRPTSTPSNSARGTATPTSKEDTKMSTATVEAPSTKTVAKPIPVKPELAGVKPAEKKAAVAKPAKVELTPSQKRDARIKTIKERQLTTQSKQVSGKYRRELAILEAERDAERAAAKAAKASA